MRSIGITDDWLTDPGIIQALGPFDLDPCASRHQPWRTATRQFTEEDDGLAQSWEGRVWLNPPYNRYVIARWLEKMATHNDGIALLHVRTETAAWRQHVWPRASAMLFLFGRQHFRRPDGSGEKGHACAPSVLVSFDGTGRGRTAATLQGSSLAGAYVWVNKG